MTKFTKMSLIAALAVAGTTASAQPLAEAIKNVDVSGTVNYRYNDYEGYNDNGRTQNEYKIAVNVNSKVNDDVAATTRFTMQSFSMDTRGSGDANVDVQLSEVYFTYTGLANTSVLVGKQGLATPFTLAHDSTDFDQTGTGIVAVSTLGPVTLAGAYFNQTSLKEGTNTGADVVNGYIGDVFDGSEDVVFASVMASFAGLNADASYIDVENILDGYTIGLSGNYNVGDVALNPYARYTEIDFDDFSEDAGLWKVGLRANMGIFGAAIGYGETEDNGSSGNTSIGGMSGLDYTAETGYDEHWRVTLTGISDASVVYASVDAQVLPALNIALKYSDLEAGSNSNEEDQSEIYGQITYDMSKNFSTYVRFGQFEYDNDEGTMGRVNVQYSF